MIWLAPSICQAGHLLLQPLRPACRAAVRHGAMSIVFNSRATAWAALRRGGLRASVIMPDHQRVTARPAYPPTGVHQRSRHQLEPMPAVSARHVENCGHAGLCPWLKIFYTSLPDFLTGGGGCKRGAWGVKIHFWKMIYAGVQISDPKMLGTAGRIGVCGGPNASPFESAWPRFGIPFSAGCAAWGWQAVAAWPGITLNPQPGWAGQRFSVPRSR